MSTQLPVRARNGGSLPLTLSTATFSDDHFSLVTALPFGLDAGVEMPLLLAFRPTVIEARVTGTLTFDDATELALSGSGLDALVVATPGALAFGDVYVGESKVLPVQLVNVSSMPVAVTVTLNAPASVTGTTAALSKTYQPGEQASAMVTFAPLAIGPMVGALELDASVPLSGRGVQALPQVCLGEVCSAASQTFEFSDGGSSRFSIRNEGNTQVSYTVRYETQRCDGGAAAFVFSNAPQDGGIVKWADATASLPMNASDSKPWQTAPVFVTSVCPGEAHVVWVREGDTRQPSVIDVTLLGRAH